MVFLLPIIKKKLVMKIFEKVSEIEHRDLTDNDQIEILKFAKNNQNDLDQKFFLALVDALYSFEEYPDLMNFFELYFDNQETDIYKHLAIYVAKYLPHINYGTVSNLFNAYRKPLTELEIVKHRYFETAIIYCVYKSSTDEDVQFTFDDVVNLIHEKPEMLRKFDRFLTLKSQFGIANEFGSAANHFEGDDVAIESAINQSDKELNDEIIVPKTENVMPKDVWLEIFKHTDEKTMVRTLITTKISTLSVASFRHVIENSKLTGPEQNKQLGN